MAPQAGHGRARRRDGNTRAGGRADGGYEREGGEDVSVFTGTGTGLVFDRDRDCLFEEMVIDGSSLQPGEFLVQLELSDVSAGTELANFTGLDPGTRVAGSWNTYLHRPGDGSWYHPGYRSLLGGFGRRPTGVRQLPARPTCTPARSCPKTTPTP
jgi:hypothetical protein